MDCICPVMRISILLFNIYIGNELTGDCIKPLSTGLSVLMGQYLSELFIDDNDELIGNPVDNEDEDVDEEDEDEEDEDVEVKDVKPYMKRMHTLCKGLFQSKRCLKIFSCISCRLSSYGICTLLRYYLKYHSEASILVRCNSNCCSEAGMNVIEEIKDENESIRFDGMLMYHPLFAFF